jgi:DNA-binding MarR family transcriptional regulator
LSKSTVVGGPDARAVTAAAPDDDGLSLRLKRIERALRRRLQPALEAEGLLFEHWQIMAALQVHPGMRMSDLAEAAVLPAASLTRHTDKLVERALVIRRIAPGDKRSVVVALSNRGIALAGRLRTLERASETVLAPGL